jgi:protocatechuate 3,4-dioxygenase beta subunit
LKHTFLLVPLLLGAISLASAQDPTALARPSSIAGTVVKEPGSQPLKKVLVQVIAESQKEGGNYTASTDSDGHFKVDNVTPGHYRLFVERTGFAGVNEREMKSDTNVVAVLPGQALDNLVLRMLATAVISGRVTDEDGDPMAGVRVVALKRVPGKAKRQALGTEGTNDLGEYRISGLFPGQYWIVAMPAPDFRDYEQRDEQREDDKKENSPNADEQNESKADTRYLTTYYPGTYDAVQASILTLKAGDEMPVNLTMVPAKTYRVRGVVTGMTSGQKPVVELVSKSGESIHATEVGRDGEFEMRGVGPGSYLLRATSSSDSQPVTARQDVTVVAGDVDGLKLAPQPSFTILGHLHVEGNAPEAPVQFSINLRPTELPDDFGFFMSQEYFGANAPVDRNGNFEWKQVSPGNYIVRLFGSDALSNFFLKSVKLGGRGIETGFTATGPASLEATVSFKAGTIDGDVIEKEKDVDKDYPVANATVVAVPEEKYRKLPDRFGVGETDQNGRFTIRGLAPGSYTIYAWQDVDENVYRDADFLKSQEANGMAVRVKEGSRQAIELKVSAAGDEWR